MCCLMEWRCNHQNSPTGAESGELVCEIIIDAQTLKELRALAIALQELMREMEKQKEKD
jgi:hypothetical protein